jgi:hypothetical protein
LYLQTTHAGLERLLARRNQLVDILASPDVFGQDLNLPGLPERIQ